MRERGIGGYFKIEAVSPLDERGDRRADRTQEREILERIDVTVRELRALLLAQPRSSKRGTKPS